MEPLRASDGPGAKVMPPTEELFPGGSWERPWIAGEDGDELEIAYEAGGAYATVEGKGELHFAVDGEQQAPIKIDEPGLTKLTEHPRHESHSLALRADPNVRIWSVSFPAAVP